VSSTEIHIKGQSRRVASVCIEGRTIIATGSWLKTATVWDAELLDVDPVPAPAAYVAYLHTSGLRADLLTFTQRLPDVTPRHPYHLEWDRVAALPLTTFAEWWARRTHRDVRRNVTRAQRLGVVVKPVPCDDRFVQAIVTIYNETPVRQGKPFWHYQKDVGTVTREIATYLERSIFLGAYYHEELIGFMKIVQVGQIAVILQILGKQQHFPKRPMNALLATAVEVCAQRGLTYLTYGEDDGGRSSLGAFKQHHGFHPVLLPRYYIPLTRIGQLALKLKLHQRVVRWLPPAVVRVLRTARTRWYTRPGRHRLVSPPLLGLTGFVTSSGFVTSFGV
jgi:hypothetical protein